MLSIAVCDDELQISEKRNDRSAPAERPFRFKRRDLRHIAKDLIQVPSYYAHLSRFDNYAVGQ